MPRRREPDARGLRSDPVYRPGSATIKVADLQRGTLGGARERPAPRGWCGGGAQWRQGSCHVLAGERDGSKIWPVGRQRVYGESYLKPA
jgi:hypothetical protein